MPAPRRHVIAVQHLRATARILRSTAEGFESLGGTKGSKELADLVGPCYLAAAGMLELSASEIERGEG
jgi:hypothetical protein